MNKPVLLDLFCRMGGATVGYQRAGFHVIGVDIEPQPGYPGDEFFKADALEFIADTEGNHQYLRDLVTMIHASPPCQEGNSITNGTHQNRPHAHPQLVPPTRDLLNRIGLPYVIEQPTSSRAGLIRRDITLCMDYFKDQIGPPPWVFRHRSFELSGWTTEQPAHVKHTGRVRGWRHYRYHQGDYIAAYGKGGGKGEVPEIQHAMGIDWMTERFDLCEAIPPAYTHWIGRQFLAQKG